MARDVEVLLIAGVDEHLPLLVIEFHLNAQVLPPHGLKRFRDGLVPEVAVVLALHLGEVLSVRIARLGQELLRLLHVGARGEVLCLVLSAEVHRQVIGVHARDAVGNKAVGRLLSTPRHLLDDGRAVDGQSKRLAHACIVKGPAGRVENVKVRAQRVSRLSLAALQELREHWSRDKGVVVHLPTLEGRQGRVDVVDHDHADLVQLHLVGIPVVGVLHHRELAVVLPFRDHEGPVAGEGARRGPATGVLFHHVGPRGEEDVVGQVVQHQGAGVLQVQAQRPLVNRRHAQLLQLRRALEALLTVLDEVADVGEGAGVLRVEHALEAATEVLRRQRLAVGPLQALPQVERPGQAVF